MYQQFLTQSGQPEKDPTKATFISPTDAPSTVYIADLPKNTSYLDLAEIFEKKIGPCTIQMKR